MFQNFILKQTNYGKKIKRHKKTDRFKSHYVVSSIVLNRQASEKEKDYIHQKTGFHCHFKYEHKFTKESNETKKAQCLQAAIIIITHEREQKDKDVNY